MTGRICGGERSGTESGAWCCHDRRSRHWPDSVEEVTNAAGPFGKDIDLLSPPKRDVRKCYTPPVSQSRLQAVVGASGRDF